MPRFYSDTCWYCGVSYYKIDNINGITVLRSPHELASLNIDPPKTLMFLNWIARGNNYQENSDYFKKFIRDNYRLLLEDAFGYRESTAYGYSPIQTSGATPLQRAWERAMEGEAGEPNYAHLDTLEKNISYFEKHCEFNGLNSFEEIAAVCFPKYAGYILDW
jgi:hypothetical protein